MDTTFACDLTVLTTEQRLRHRELSEKLRPMVLEFRELPNGYTARISSSAVDASEVQEFLALEKLCCPFFTLTMDVENGSKRKGGIYNVRIEGYGDIKPFIRAEFAISKREIVN